MFVIEADNPDPRLGREYIGGGGERTYNLQEARVFTEEGDEEGFPRTDHQDAKELEYELDEHSLRPKRCRVERCGKCNSVKLLHTQCEVCGCW